MRTRPGTRCAPSTATSTDRKAADIELQAATVQARAGDAAPRACELIRDAASETWTIATGEVWTPGADRGAARISRRPAGSETSDPGDQIPAAREAAPGGQVVAFRGRLPTSPRMGAGFSTP